MAADLSPLAGGIVLVARRFFEEVPSTQEVALALARDGAPVGTYVVGRRQTRGRGRLDHRWESPPGGLYLSLVLSEPRCGRSLVPMALAVAVADAIRPYGAEARVKWPNDLLIVDPSGPARKVAGILVDRIDTPDGPRLIAGVGVNVAADRSAFPPAVVGRIVQLTELAGGPVDLDRVEQAVVPGLLAAVDELATRDGWRRSASRCREALFGRGRKASVDGRVAGTIGELGDDGSLWLEGDDGPVQVRSGELVVEGS